MRVAPFILRRLTSVLSTTAVIAAGLVVTAAVAPSAAADLSPIADPTPALVTADALPTVQIDGVVWDQKIVGNTVFAGGQFANARPAGAAAGTNLTTRNNLLSYNLTTGALNTAFAPSLNAQVKTVAVSPDGSRVYVGGSFTNANGSTRNRIAAYNVSTGALITTFAPNVTFTVNAIVATNTTVYVGGAFTTAGGQARQRLAAFNASNGSLTAWAPAADATVQAMVISPDGAIIVGGSFQNVNGSPAYGLAKLDATNGSLLPWNTTNLIRNAGASAAILSLTTDGNQIYGTGYHFGAGGNLEGTFSADPVSGDIKWVQDCHGDTYDAYADGNAVYTVSHAHYCGNVGGFFQSDPWSVNMRHAIAFTTNVTGTLGHDPHGYYDFFGTPSPSMINWFPDLAVGSYTGKNQSAWDITGNGKYVVMGGEFPLVNGSRQQGIVRFATPDIAPKKVGPSVKGAAFNPTVTPLPSGSLRIAWTSNWDMDDYSLTYKLLRNNVEIYNTSASNPFWSRPTMGFIDSTVVPGTNYRYRLSATDSDGNVALSEFVTITAPAAGSASAYAQTVIADGAAPYWPLNEAAGSVLLDNSGFNDADSSAALTRQVLPGAVASDAASSFNGATSAATRTAIQGPDTFTAQAWIKTTTTSGGKILGFASSQTGNSNSYDRHVYMDNEGRIWYGVYPNGVATINSGPGFNDGQWHMISVSLGADGMKLYIDDKLIGQRADVTWGQNYQGFWRIGGDNIGGWPNQPGSSFFNGSIDEVAIYPTVLSRQTIDAQWVASGRTSTIPAAPADAYGAAVFNDNPLLFWRLGESSGNSAVDSGPNGDQLGIYQNGVQQGSAGGIKDTTNTAATFDGFDDLVASVESFDNPKNYSEEAWFKTTSTNGGKIIGFGASQTGTSNGYDRHVYMSNDGKVTFGTWTGFTNTITTSNALNDGQWHHVVATQSATTGMSMYIDGSLVGTNPQTGADNFVGYWRVGGDNHWGCCSPFIAATIDDVAVYESVLTPAQVANHFNLGSTVVLPNQLPSASFTSASDFLNATFDGSASSDSDGTILSYSWSFGDTSTGAGVTASHTYASAGTFTVTLTVTDDDGGVAVSTKQVTVEAPPVNVAPQATFSAAPSVLAVSVDASASTDSDGTIASYAWDFGDSNTGTGITTNHTYVAAGTYLITLVVTDDDGATNSTTKSVTVAAPVNQAPLASFTASSMQLAVSVDASGSSDPDGTVAGYAWDFGDGATATGVTASHTYSTAGTKTVTLTATDNNGASTSTSQPVEVTAPPVNVLPVASFTSMVAGLTANLESTSTDPDGTIVSQTWDFGDGSPLETTVAAVHTYATAGAKTVTLTVTDNAGATSMSVQTVAVVGMPPANVAPTAAFTASSAGLVLSVDGATSTDSDGTISVYAWNFGDEVTESQPNPTTTHTYAAAGTYSVELTVTDSGGATHSVTQQITVTAPAPPALAADAFPRSVTNGWGQADTGGAWTVAGGLSNFSVNGGTGKVRLSAAGAGPTASIGAVASADSRVNVSVSLDKASTGGGVYFSVDSRKVGNSAYRTTVKLLADGRVQVQLNKVVNGASTNLRTITVAGYAYALGDTVNIAFEVSGTTSVNLSSKAWKDGTAEPAWQATAIDGTSPMTSAGGVSVLPYLSGTSTNAPVVLSVDNFKVTAV